MVLFAYVDRFLHFDISERKSMVWHFILGIPSVGSFIFLLIYDFKSTFFIIPGIFIIFYVSYFLYKAHKDLGKKIRPMLNVYRLSARRLQGEIPGFECAASHLPHLAWLSDSGPRVSRTSR